MFMQDNKNDRFKAGGDNVLGNVLFGGLTGLADSMQQPGYYMPSFNWAGNGIARGGIQYYQNPNYRDYASGGQILSSLFRDRQDSKNDEIGNNDNKNDLSYEILGRLSTMNNKIGDWASNLRGSIGNNGKLLFSKMFNNIGDFGQGLRRISAPDVTDVLA